MVYEPKKKYEWNDNFKLKVDANVVGGVCEHLEEKDGSVTAQSFLDFSKSEDSPTHDLFEWDDAVAGNYYRLFQSRRTIGNLRVVVKDKEKEEIQVRAYVNVVEKDTAKYENICSVVSSKEKTQIVLKHIRDELHSFVVRNKNVEGFISVMEEELRLLKQE